MTAAKNRLLTGASWALSTRWIIKVLGFISTMIMARILSPEDYGIVAIGTLAVGMIQVFLDFGASTAILRTDNPTQNEINSAWTLRLIQSIFAALTIAVLSPIVAKAFNDERLVGIMLILSICVFTTGLSNMAQVLSQKEYRFFLSFKMEIIAKTASILMTLIAGYFLQDYRALILGIASGYLTSLVLGYAMHEHRPKIERSEIAGIWSLTKWLLLANIATYVLRKGDELIAAKVGTPHQYGNYHVGSDLGQLPIQEVGPASLRALLPVLSELRSDKKRLRCATIKTSLALNTLIWPIGLGFSLVSVAATELILGDKWESASIFVSIFALVATFQTAPSPIATLMIVEGATKQQTKIAWLEFFIFLASTAVLISNYGLVGVAFARLIASASCIVSTIVLAHYFCDLNYRYSIQSLLRPIACSVLMIVCTYGISSLVENLGLKVIVTITFGAVVYTFFSYFAWILMGRPEGLESTVLDRLNIYYKRAKK